MTEPQGHKHADALPTHERNLTMQYSILPAEESADAILAFPLIYSDTGLIEMLDRIGKLGWELAPDRLFRLFSNEYHIGLIRTRHGMPHRD